MYISHQGLKAMQDQHIHECLQRADARRMVPLEQQMEREQTPSGSSPNHRGAFSLRSVPALFRRTLARV